MNAEPIEVGSITDISSYLASLDWGERWLWVLLGFHAWCLLFTVVSLKFSYYRPQVVLFVIYLALAYSSEYLNEWLAKNYKKFSREQYFDSQGMFISLVFSLPLLVNVVLIVGFWMWDVANVMIGLKKAKVKQMKKAQEKISSEASEETKPEDTAPKTDTEKKED